mgnify:CR=1 FL=1
MNNKQYDEYLTHIRYLGAHLEKARSHAAKCVELADLKADKTDRETYRKVAESLLEVETTLDVLDGINSGY